MTKFIGITAHRVSIGDEAAGVSVHHEAAATAYVRAAAKAGAIPIIIPVVEPDDRDRLDQILERFDAIVITGGADVDPSQYGQATDPLCGTTEPQRDEIDLAVARACIERNQPTLAICRGIQVLNVALGGSLTQHIDDHMVVPSYNGHVHDLAIDATSRLAAILDTDRYWSNSLHHQCIDRIGAGGRVVARAADGTVEAIEVEHAPNVVGVQWHPEHLRHDDRHLNLFRALVR